MVDSEKECCEICQNKTDVKLYVERDKITDNYIGSANV